MFYNAINIFVLRGINSCGDSPIDILCPIALALPLVNICPPHLFLLIVPIFTITWFLGYKYSTFPHFLFLLYCLQRGVVLY